MLSEDEEDTKRVVRSAKDKRCGQNPADGPARVPVIPPGRGRGADDSAPSPPPRDRFEELTNLIKTIRNAMKIRDVTKCLEEFELLGKAYGKAKSIVDKEGVPRFYVRILADLEDYLNEVREGGAAEGAGPRGGRGRGAELGPVVPPAPQLWEDKEGKKKMNKNNAKALSTLRQKIRKYNRDYETHIANYKQVGGGAGPAGRGRQGGAGAF